jgi:hypothetical protein
MNVAFSPDGTRLLSASQGQGGSGELVVWDVQSWQPVGALAQQATLRALGAIEQEANQPSPPGYRLRGEELVGPKLDFVPFAEVGKN